MLRFLGKAAAGWWAGQWTRDPVKQLVISDGDAPVNVSAANKPGQQLLRSTVWQLISDSDPEASDGQTRRGIVVCIGVGWPSNGQMRDMRGGCRESSISSSHCSIDKLPLKPSTGRCIVCGRRANKGPPDVLTNNKMLPKGALGTVEEALCG